LILYGFIEHGTYLDEESAGAMRERDAILVPTRTIVHELVDHGAGPPYAIAKIAAIAERHAGSLALARRAGVTVAMGTDLSVTGPGLPASWGRNGRELPLLVKDGFSPLEAIEAATAAAPATLGPQAPRSGLLTAGYDADVIVLDADPLADIGVLAQPERITAVWRGGCRVKG
jgi:imidazolonepropionase-like amidohydrolase